MNIVYRACSTGNPDKERPIKDKYELVQTCFHSFIRAFKGVEYTLTILLDKPTAPFRHIFTGCEVRESYYGSFDEGNIKSFHTQIDIATSSEEPFLFIEDDYLFIEGAGRKIQEILQSDDLLFVSPYDHPDYYRDERHGYDRTIKALSHHWATASATTLTFGGTAKAIRQEASVMKSYGWADYPMWLDITPRIPLYAPIPSLATHMETQHLAPCVAWLENPL